jgi:hypothetical protein
MNARYYRQIMCYLQAGGFFYDTVSAMCFSALQRTRAGRGREEGGVAASALLTKQEQ